MEQFTAKLVNSIIALRNDQEIYVDRAGNVYSLPDDARYYTSGSHTVVSHEEPEDED